MLVALCYEGILVYRWNQAPPDPNKVVLIAPTVYGTVGYSCVDYDKTKKLLFWCTSEGIYRGTWDYTSSKLKNYVNKIKPT